MQLSHPPNLILFGPPGAGKSTQASLLVERWPIVAISTGKKLREEIAAGTTLGKQVRDVLDAGQLVHDELMIATLRKWLEEIPADKGFLLDGFPRTVEQAKALNSMLEQLGRPLIAVIKLSLTVSEAVYRLGGRRICYGAGPEQIIHINDEEAVASCLERGGMLVQRPDDLPNVIVRRLAVYEEETEPLMEYYRPLGFMHSIDSSGSPEEVAQRIITAVEG